MWMLKEMGLNPRPVDMGPDLGQMLERCDGALLIGDRALDEASNHPELVRMDLGQTWLELTGHPMVFAVFAAHRDAPSDILEEAYQLLLSQLNSFESDPIVRNSITESTAKRSGFSKSRIEQYFDEVVLRLDDNGNIGLDYFLDEVCGVKNYKNINF